jgi:deoxyribonuclease-4
MPLNSRRDRHENLGKGTIPLEVLKRFATDPALAEVPVILETPTEDGITEYQQELALLRDL